MLNDIAPKLHGRKSIILAILAQLPFVEYQTSPKLTLKLSLPHKNV